MNSFTLAEALALGPAFVLLATAILLLMYEVFAEQTDRSYAANFAALGLVIALAWSLVDVEAPRQLLFGSGARGAPLAIDAFARVAWCTVSAAGLIAVLLSPGCTSFEMFANEFDRGRRFKLLVCDFASRP